MQVLVCPQEFKGSLTAFEAARAIAAGVRAALPDADVVELPLADGGPGTVEIVRAATHGRLVAVDATGPLSEPLRAFYALLPANAAGERITVIEAAATSGLLLVPTTQRDPARASTFGVGQQLLAALDSGSREVIVGVGGTATNDGGAGAAQALGYLLLDSDGQPIGRGPLELLRLSCIDPTEVTPLLPDRRVRVAVDVRNRLLGPEGATWVYGPQKGVTPELAPQLERALEAWARVVERDLGVAIADIDGGGAGGGLAAGLVGMCGATIESGAALVGTAVGLRATITAADLVVTGEGRLDAQTAYGKTVSYVAELALAAGKPCLAVAGRVEVLRVGIIDAESSASPDDPVEAAMAHAAPAVEAAAVRLLRRYVS